MESYDILVILLSVTLLVALVLLIIAAIMILKVVKQVKATTDAAEEAVNNVQEFSRKLRTVGDVSAIGSAISQAAKYLKNRGDK